MSRSINRKKNSAHAVADYFLLKIDPSAGDTISNLKMQKLCYFSQVASLVLMDMPVFEDEIQAWAHGPVVVNLYRRFRKYGWQSIDPTDLKTRPHKELEAHDIAILDAVWRIFSGCSAKALEDISHNDGPWKDIYKANKEGGRCTAVISEKNILDYYQSNPQHDWLKKLAVTTS